MLVIQNPGTKQNQIKFDTFFYRGKFFLLIFVYLLPNGSGSVVGWKDFPLFEITASYTQYQYQFKVQGQYNTGKVLPNKPNPNHSIKRKDTIWKLNILYQLFHHHFVIFFELLQIH